MKTCYPRTEDYRSTSADINEGLDSAKIARHLLEFMVVIETMLALFTSTLCHDVLRKSVEYCLPTVALLIKGM